MGATANPAIELLVAQVDELERKANAYRTSVNILCAQDGAPPFYPDVGGGSGKGGGGAKPQGGSADAEAHGHTPMSSIRPDTFYGKPQQTAVREFLMFRKGAGLGPAKPAEILEGLRAGGYQVQASSDEIALVGMRAMLRKRTAVFHKLPNGTWGLTEWYPNAKPAKGHAEKSGAAKDDASADSDAENDEDITETSAPINEAAA